MRSLQPLRLLFYPLRVPGTPLRELPYAYQPCVRYCSCSALPQAAKPTLLNPTTVNPLTPAADHRVLGTALDLFSTSRFSPGSPLFHPDGAHIVQKLQSFLRAQYTTFGFREVITPTIYKQSLWEQSGHWENYKDDMFEVTGRGAAGGIEDGKRTEIGEDEKYGLKPMNCPGHCLLFKSQKRSFRDLPIRYADFSALHRNEISGALSGLTRVRRFHQDDGHIFCRPSQVGQEIEKTLQFVGLVYATFGLGPYKLVLSTRPKDQFMGEVEDWDRAEAQLGEALNKSGREWKLNEGDGAFYGPKMDIILKDSDGKEHQTATIQLDFQLPQRFGLSYQAPAPDLESKGLTTTEPGLLAHSGDVTPVIIHRAILGSLERFMALLIEHYKGRWPFWLSPRQGIILVVGEDKQVIDYAEKVVNSVNHLDKNNDTLRPRPLDTAHFAIDIDSSGRSIAKKLAEAKSKHYNLIFVVGPKEATAEALMLDMTGQPQTKKVMDLLKALPLSDLKLDNRRAIKLNARDLQGIMRLLCKEYL
ncbi:hypothetical protein MMC34_006981 [Xylographa carneopallida]|nr:hypothetical protein [Xylographa carneopallida]